MNVIGNENLEIPTPEEFFFDSELRQNIDRVLGTLTDREDEVMRLRYGLPNSRGVDEALTQKAVGEILGITDSAVGAIQKKALSRLRHVTRANRLRPFIDPDFEESVAAKKVDKPEKAPKTVILNTFRERHFRGGKVKWLEFFQLVVKKIDPIDHYKGIVPIYNLEELKELYAEFKKSFVKKKKERNESEEPTPGKKEKKVGDLVALSKVVKQFSYGQPQWIRDELLLALTSNLKPKEGEDMYDKEEVMKVVRRFKQELDYSCFGGRGPDRDYFTRFRI